MSENIIWSSHGWELRRDPSTPGRLTLIPATAVAARGAARLSRMAEALRDVSHPRLLSDVRMRSDTGTTFLELPDPGGETLASRLARGPLPATEAEPAIRDVASALAALHARGIVHRALCPELIFLVSDGAVLCPGDSLKPQFDGAVTQAGFFVPSRPPFTAPELLRGTEATPASDMWALGMLLYVAVTGQSPIATTDPFQYEAAVRSGMPTLPNEVPTPLRETYARTTKVRAADRISAAQVASLLGGAPTPPNAGTPVRSGLRVSAGAIVFTAENEALVGRADPTIGHTPEVDLSDLDPNRTVSRRHARLTVAPSGVRIEDLGSRNGTRVGARRVTDTVVASGTHVQFGSVDVTIELA